jgi:mannose-6-phosphate isomerase-like protein (cupin superfamily)
MEQGTTRARLDPDSPERLLALRRELQVSSFGINQLVLRPGQRGRIHRHQRQEEVYLVLEGVLTIVLEDGEIQLSEGELIRVAPQLRRQLVNCGHERLVLLALGGDAVHQGRDGEAFTDWDQPTGALPQEVPLPSDVELD